MAIKRFLKFLPALSLVIIAAACGSSGSSDSQRPSLCKSATGSATVLLKDGSFDPALITVKQCTKVTFQNVGTQPHWPASDFHPTHGIYPEFDPKRNVDPGQSWSFIFDRIGTWHYHDHLSPEVTGTVKVTN